MSTLVYVHGWAMGPEIWRAVMDKLPDYPCLQTDLGFRRSPVTPVAHAPWVITHSLGLMWALNNISRPWAGLVAINGFTRFTRSDNFPGVEPHLLERMKSRLREDMNGVVDSFLRRCGMETPYTREFDQAMLSQGLEWLTEWDTRTQFAQIGCPVLTIGGAADPIITEAHSLACFSDFPLVMIEGGGHLLPLTHANWLASRIEEALVKDWSA